MKGIIELIEALAILLLLALLGACAMPEFHQRFATYGDDGITTRTLAENHEKSWLIGERHAIAGPPGAAYDMGKADITAVAGYAVMAYGLSIGNIPAVLTGAITTMFDSYTNRSKPVAGAVQQSTPTAPAPGK